MKLFAFLLTLFIGHQGISQNLDANIKSLADDFAKRVSKTTLVKLTLADFVNSEGKTDPLTEYIRGQLEDWLIDAGGVQVLERKKLNKLLEEHHLQSQGLIDEALVKSAISFTKIDGLINGEITYLGDQVKIRITATSVESSLIYAGSTSPWISDAAINDILGRDPTICSECKGKGTVQVMSMCLTCNGSGYHVCSDCNGTGKRNGMTVGSYIACEKCGSLGKFNCNACSGKGKTAFYQTCPKCNGKFRQTTSDSPNDRKGNVNNAVEICPACLGNGKIKEQKLCGACGGSGEAPFGASSNWEKRPCGACSGAGKIDVLINCQRCGGKGKL